MKKSHVFFLVLGIVFVRAEAINIRELVDLPEIVSKDELRPLKLIENSHFSLRKHPFNPNAFWLIDDSKFDSREESIEKYGLSISRPPELLWQEFYAGFEMLDNSKVYISATTKCLVNKHFSGGDLDKVFVLLDINGNLYMLSGRPDFFNANIELDMWCQ